VLIIPSQTKQVVVIIQTGVAGPIEEMKRVILSLIKFIDTLKAKGKIQAIGKKQMEHRRFAHLVHQGLIKTVYTKAVA
jgi:hypothetical protein